MEYGVMMGDQVVDINVATVEDLETLVGVGRAKAEAIVNTRTSMVEFGSVEDLLAVPGIGRSLIEQNRVCLVCRPLSGAGTAPLTRHAAARRSLRRASHDTRPRPEPQHEPQAEGPVTGGRLSRGATREQAGEHSCPTRLPGSGRRADPRPREDSPQEGVEGEGRSLVPEEEGSDCCDCCGGGGAVGQQDPSNTGPGEEGEQEGEEGLGSCVGQPVRRELHCGCSEALSGGGGGGGGGVGGSGGGSGGLGTDTPHEDTPPRTCPSRCLPYSSSSSSDGEEPGEGQDEDNEDEEDEEDEEGHMDEDGLEEESDHCMTVDLPCSPSGDKKQIKRKSEVCSDSKGVCPVKKSCKAVEHRWWENSRRKVSGLAGHKVSPPPAGLKSWLAKYQTWSPAQKRYALDSLIDVCDLNEVRHLHQIILPQFQRDFISLLPKELALYVLSFLPPKDLLRAAQTCKYWNILAADNLLWREKCREAGIEDHMVVMDRRRRKGTSMSHVSPYKTAFMRQHKIEMNWRMASLRPPRVLKGHDDHVITCLQFSGNTIVSGSDDNTLKVWNATSGKCMRTLTGHTGGVWSSQMSGNLIVSGSTDRMLRVWDADTGECYHILYGHTSTVRCLHLHGNKVVSGSRDATLRVWDVRTGACERVLVGHVAAVRCVQYNGRLVVSGAYDYMVKVWNAERQECLHTLQGHTNRVYSLQFDGVHVVSGSLDTSIRVWDVETGQCRHTLMGHQSLTSGMELKNNILISGNADSTVKVWDIVTGRCLQTLSGPNKHRSAVTCLQFNNMFVVTSSDDGTVKLWDVRTGEFLRNLVALESGGSGGVVWRIRASDTKLVCAVGSRNGTEETKLLVLDFDVYDNVK
ncbi:F-box/WD repeat-containing protein 7-like [Portunus trituberculatus]|uniref:F-box/WD repeat-containing protein 7-like n=1 Tax=Portunus trituberculatus TaxID=210409 RepID=UPI001E1D2059|nr:F-box/WD repeat-containing protein 7-like [Portunus trituberculatus]